MYKNLRKKTEGFTIIEVLIVLAIAGLIMLVVFLAVPALQRNSRNTSRNNDASRLSALVTECMANRNGVVESCSDPATEIGFEQEDFSIFQEIEVHEDFNNDFVVGGDDEGITAVISYNSQCTQEGDAKEDSTNDRKFTVAYQLESSNGDMINRCIGSE